MQILAINPHITERVAVAVKPDHGGKFFVGGRAGGK
jgi:hypothetical protein